MKESNDKKTILGQYFTSDNKWLFHHILSFIKNSNCTTAYDPFAGEGHLLNVAQMIGFATLIGLDIDPSLGWEINDSLVDIPHKGEDAIIITNPPYLSNYSASRKKIYNQVEQYFVSSKYDDLYLIALANMIKAQKFVVAIIPETFINSNFKYKNLLASVTIIEKSLFEDTDTPVVVACFDGVYKDLSDVKVYKNDVFINDLKSIENMRLCPNKDVPMKFNSSNGWLAVRCVDSTDPTDRLRFAFKDDMKYSWDLNIKHSSRLMTLVDIEIPDDKKNVLVVECNSILNQLRRDSSDIIFSPFKGNAKNGVRRRRLDFKTCRAIIEGAYKKIVTKEKGGNYEQLSLF